MLNKLRKEFLFLISKIIFIVFRKTPSKKCTVGEVTRENWRLIEAQAFLRSYDSAPRRPLHRPHVRKLDRRHTGRPGKKDNLQTGEGGGSGEEPIIRLHESLVIYKSFNPLSKKLSTEGATPCQIIIYYFIFYFSLLRVFKLKSMYQQFIGWRFLSWRACHRAGGKASVP